MRKVSEEEHKEWLERYLLGETCRSISKDYPFNENTISAFQNAIYDNNYQGFELDIRTTKDKKFVVVHDFFSDGNLISKTNYQDLNKDIPLLEDVLKLPTDKIILIEIKEKDIDIFKLNFLLEKFKIQNLYVMSFLANL